MYINEVLRQCDTLCPNEYSDIEKYIWCDELSAMLTQEHNKKYEKITVKPQPSGEYILPEGVTYEMVDRIIDCGNEILKYDFRSYGIRYMYGIHGRFIIPEHNRVRESIDIVYLKKHEPIRNVIINDTVKFKRNGFYIENPKLIEGDSVTVKTEDTFFEDVAILDIEHFDDMVFFITVGDDVFNSLFSDDETEKEVQCEIKRVVTDETVCDAPYDRMYIDYVNAQICYFQRDMNNYNQHMNLFNQRLNAYEIWLQQRKPQDKDGQFINWW